MTGTGQDITGISAFRVVQPKRTERDRLGYAARDTGHMGVAVCVFRRSKAGHAARMVHAVSVHRRITISAVKIRRGTAIVKSVENLNGNVVDSCSEPLVCFAVTVIIDAVARLFGWLAWTTLILDAVDAH